MRWPGAAALAALAALAAGAAPPGDPPGPSLRGILRSRRERALTAAEATGSAAPGCKYGGNAIAFSRKMLPNRLLIVSSPSSFQHRLYQISNFNLLKRTCSG